MPGVLTEEELAQVRFQRRLALSSPAREDRRYFITVTLSGQSPVQLRSGDSMDIATKDDGVFWLRFAQKPLALPSDAEVVTELLRSIAGFERLESPDPHVILRVLKGIVDPNWLDAHPPTAR